MSSDMPPPPVPSAPASSAPAASPAAPAEGSGSVDDSAAPRTSQRARRPSTRLEQSGEASGSSYSLRDSLRGRKTAPRLKLNLKTAVQAGASGGTGTGPKTTPYMQGFDRELDSSDDETGQGLAFEEQLVLRMPPGEACEQLREWVRRREIGKQGAQVELKFKDSRRAVFKMGSQLFAAKLVDLPTILETHKTLDARQLFKIADISQMLLVTHQIQSEAEATRAAPPPPPPDREGSAHINADTAQTLPGAGEYVFDHGITPPMRFARKRRFRRRAHKRVIETVEKEIERLLADDRKADKVEYEMIDAAQADFSDDDEQGGGGAGMRRGHSTAETPAPGEDGASAMGDGASMDGEDREGAGSAMEEDWDGEGAGEVDHDLAAELEAVMRGDASDDASEEEESSMGGSMRGGSGRATSDDGDGDLWGDDDGDESGGDDEEGQDEDLDDEEKERRVREAQLEAQCREMDALVKRKQAEAGATTNALIKKRQLDALKRLVAERDMKTSQLADVRAERRERAAEAAAVAAAAAESAGAPTPAPAADEPVVPAKPSEKGKEREVSSARSASSAAPTALAAPAPAPAPTLALPTPAAAPSAAGTAAQPMEVDDEADADADGDIEIGDADAPGDEDADADADEELWS